MENNTINYQKNPSNQTSDLKRFVGICIIFLSIKFSFLFFISLWEYLLFWLLVLLDKQRWTRWNANNKKWHSFSSVLAVIQPWTDKMVDGIKEVLIVAVTLTLKDLKIIKMMGW